MLKILILALARPNKKIFRLLQPAAVIMVWIGLFIWSCSVYQAGAAPPEPEKELGSTPTPPDGGVVTSANMTETLSLPAVSQIEIEPLAAIMTQNFEGAWPAPGWQLNDQSSSDGGQYLWGKRNCHPRTGSFGGWSVGGGVQGSALSCLANYPNNANTAAVFGPFNLNNATVASLTYHFWGQTEGVSGCPFDFLFVGSSTNGTNFLGSRYCGNATNGPAGNGYYQGTLNLSNRLGQSQVWVAFAFVSDSSITFNGITIDDVTLDVATINDPLNAPSNLTATPLSQNIIGLSWLDNSSNETSFKIERSPNGSGGWTQIATVGANVQTYTDTGLTCGTAYFYRVRASNGSNNSGYSNIANATPSCPPLAPTNLTAVAVTTTNQIRLIWQDNSNNEFGFTIERSLNGATWTPIASVGPNVTSYINIGLACNTTYFYRVRAYNLGGNSGYSNTANAVTNCTASLKLYLPIIMRNFAPPPPPPPDSKPKDGHWTGTTSRSQPMSFDISSGGTVVNNFKLKTNFQVGPCSGTFETTLSSPRPITNNQFSSNSGSFTFSGQFSTSTSASGTYAYVNHFIPGCGIFNQSGTWTANAP